MGGDEQKAERPSTCTARTYLALFQIWKRRKEIHMKYLFAWALGVPGVLVIARRARRQPEAES